MGAVFGVFVVLALQGCATSPMGKAYDTIYSAAVTYDTAMNYIGEEYRAGRLSEEKKVEITEVATRYRAAVTLANYGLLGWKKAELAGDKQGMEKWIELVRVAMDLVEEAKEALTTLISGGEKV